MKNEELKVALCGYLPHGCSYARISKNLATLKDETKYMGELSMNGNIHNIYNNVLSDFTNMKYLPILYNISSLTKPIIVKGYNGGEEFVPIEKIDRIIPDKCFINKFSFKIEFNNGYKEFFTFDEMEIILNLLNRWKIDYRNLIGQGLAIDVETLEINPYK